VKPSILHIISSLNTGGAEIFLLRLISTLSDFDHHVVSLTASSDKPLLKKFKARTRSLHFLDMKKTDVFNIKKIFGLRSIIRSVSPDILQTWMYHANLLGSLAAWGLKTPLIWNIRNGALNDQHPQKLPLTTLTGVIVKAGALCSHYFPHNIIFNSFESADLHKKWGYYANKTLVIPNGFDTKTFKPNKNKRGALRKQWRMSDKDLVIGFVGRDHPQKDVSTFLTAAQFFLKNEPQARFVMCGKGFDKHNQKLVLLLKDLGISDRFLLLGRLDNIHEIYNGFDIFCSSSSYGEAFPNVLAEAMACGVPCVATEVGDARHILGSLGVLCSVKNPEKLAQALKEILRRKIDAPSLRRRIIDHYSLEKIAELYSTFYKTLLANGGNHTV
jgi:glycosyltransferase involved in cell wall biosynthesis